jgi:hypothetical protein
MGEICSADNRNLTKHQAVLARLLTIAARIKHSDVIDLWEFDNAHRHVGSARGGNSLQSLMGRLSGPAGGTEIGAALAGVAAQSRGRDVSSSPMGRATPWTSSLGPDRQPLLCRTHRGQPRGQCRASCGPDGRRDFVSAGPTWQKYSTPALSLRTSIRRSAQSPDARSRLSRRNDTPGVEEVKGR